VNEMGGPQQHSGKAIVVGVDGSQCSIAAAEWAANQADFTGSEAVLVATWDWPSSYGWAPPIPEDFDPAGESQRMLDQIAESMKAKHPDAKVSTKVVEGHPAPVLVKESKHAQLLVVGSRGHGEFTGMLLGSVSQHCVTNAHCPVLVMRGI